ncbi:boophilin-G2 [Procambarus clarkii]|uniref:boophilin-G2 n=1 Tax=Procambarus clarkii TaxID=6728 RepID=UPI001E673EE6|nr:putative Kunitz-type serine protease inhibitor [Procambarus clarkii]
MELLVAVLVSLVSAASSLTGNAITDDSTGASDGSCHAPKDVGSCSGQQEAWHYSAAESRCIFFVYSGCGGNANRFASRAACEEACEKPRCPNVACPDTCSRTQSPEGCEICACTRDEARAVCTEQSKRGYCRALYHNWAWDNQEHRCVQFLYGGCGGNQNNFETEEECMRVCSGV